MSSNNIEKINFIYQSLEATIYFLENEKLQPTTKRVFSRIFYLRVDDLIRILSSIEVIKNSAELSSLESAFDRDIRNKLSAHHQPIEPDRFISKWNNITFESLDEIWTLIKKIVKKIEEELDFQLGRVDDYEILGFDINDAKIKVSNTLTGITENNTLTITPLNRLQKKIMRINTIINFVELLLDLTCKLDDPDTKYKQHLFDIAWLLIICDTYSLIENLYKNTSYEKSLKTFFFEENIKGKELLQQGDNNRDSSFELELSAIRNQFAAHIDERKDIKKTFYDFFYLIWKKHTNI